MFNKPMTNILIRIFTTGFYRAHAGLFLFIGLVMVGSVPPQFIWEYQKTLMLAFITSGGMMLIVFGIWLLYTLKAVQYIASQLYAVNQQFLFYSINSFSKNRQFKSWAVAHSVILFPILTYGSIAFLVAIFSHHFLAAAIIFLFMLTLIASGAFVFVKLVNRLIDGSNQSFLLRLSSKWKKPFYSLFIFHLFDKMKVQYLITKFLSWLIIVAIFNLFDDVKHDVRVAGIAVLAIISAHAVLIFQEHVFENQYLVFARNLPYTSFNRFINFFKTYLLLLLPEAIWLFTRFNPSIGAELLLMGVNIALFYHCLLYSLGIDMEIYLQWILGAFVLMFWVLMFKLIWLLVPLNLAIAYRIFYRRYYSAK
jgi:hypothetical protein